MSNATAIKESDGFADLSTEELMQGAYWDLDDDFDRFSDDGVHQAYAYADDYDQYDAAYQTNEFSVDFNQSFHELRHAMRHDILAHKIKIGAFSTLLAFALGVVTIWAQGIVLPVSSVLFVGGGILICTGLACLANQWVQLLHEHLFMWEQPDLMLHAVSLRGVAGTP
jgi:hypothetical protein